jgi:hypothetical protein
MQKFSAFVIPTLICVACAPPRDESASIRNPKMLRQVPQGIVAQSPPDAPILTRKKNGHYRVTQPWTVEMDGQVWHIQKGYNTNGITAPAMLKSSLGDGVDKPETWAAVYHDWLFTQKGISRAQADQLFYKLLIAYGVPSPKARIMYTFVSAYSASKSVR